MSENKVSGLTRLKNLMFPGWGINPSNAPLQTGEVPPPPDGHPYTPKDLRTAIMPLQLSRIRQDVQTWRDAVNEAENAWLPHRVKMQRIFMDTVLNPHVTACLEKRRNMTVLREFAIQDKAGVINEEWTQWFHDRWFDDMLSYILDAKFFGYSLVGIGDITDGLPEECFIIKRWDVSPDRDNVTNMPYMPSGVPFLEGPQADWHIWVPTSSEIGARRCGYGLLYKVAMYEILLRDCIAQWADFAEVYGQPTRWAKTRKLQGDPEFMMLETALQNMASNPYIITDLDDQLEIIEPSKDNGAGGTYETLAFACERQISKVLLGHADALDSTPGKLGGTQGELSPQQSAMAEIEAVDGRFCEAVVNKELIPKLKKLGFNIPNGLYFKFMNDGELQAKRKTDDANALATAQWVKMLFDAGLNVDPTFVSEKTGAPILKKEVTPVQDPFTVNLKSKSYQNKL